MNPQTASPYNRSWAVEIRDSDALLGGGTLIGTHLVLTARHVLHEHQAADLRVVFPATNRLSADSVQVSEAILPSSGNSDVAVLVLTEGAPAGATPAQLSLCEGQDLIDRQWWAYGASDPVGDSAYGKFEEALNYGIVRLDTDAASKCKVVQGFSGAGVWSTHHQAVVAIIIQAKSEGDARALLVATAAQALPPRALIGPRQGSAPASRAEPSYPANTTSKSPKHSLRVVRDGCRLVPTVLDGSLMLVEDADDDPAIMVSPDGSVLARREGANLHVARLNRAIGTAIQWPARVPLDALPDGDVLAVSAAGRADVSFVWAGTDGTWLLIARATDGTLVRVGKLSTAAASAAVVIGARALLALPRQDGTVGCRAFAGVDVASVVAAAAGGRTLALAQGVSRASGEIGAWVEVNGLERQRADTTDVALELPLAWRQSPSLVGPDGHAIAVSVELRSRTPYEHWTTALSSAAANA